MWRWHFVSCLKELGNREVGRGGDGSRSISNLILLVMSDSVCISRSLMMTN